MGQRAGGAGGRRMTQRKPRPWRGARSPTNVQPKVAPGPVASGREDERKCLGPRSRARVRGLPSPVHSPGGPSTPSVSTATRSRAGKAIRRGTRSSVRGLQRVDREQFARCVDRSVRPAPGLWRRCRSAPRRVSLSTAAKRAGTTPNTVLRHARPALERRGGRYSAAPADRLARPMLVLGRDVGVVTVSVRGSRQASLIGGHWNAVHTYLATGSSSALRAYAGRSVAGVEFETDLDVIDELRMRASLSSRTSTRSPHD